MDPTSRPDWNAKPLLKAILAASQRVQRYLSHSFRISSGFTSTNPKFNQSTDPDALETRLPFLFPVNCLSASSFLQLANSSGGKRGEGGEEEEEEEARGQ